MAGDGETLIDLMRKVDRDRDDLNDREYERIARGARSLELTTLDPESRSPTELDELHELYRPFSEIVRTRIIEDVLARNRFQRKMALLRRLLISLAACVPVLSVAILHLTGRDAHPTFPLEYALEIEGGERDLRALGDPGGEPLRIRPDTWLELVFRPHRRIGDHPDVRCALASSPDQDRVIEWSPPVKRAPHGTIIISGRGGELFSNVEPGEWRIGCVVGFPKKSLNASAIFRDPPAGDLAVLESKWPIKLLAAKNPEPRDAAPLPLEVEFSGCASIRSPAPGTLSIKEPVCVVGNEPLRLWAKVPDDVELRLAIGDAESMVGGWSADGGRRVDVEAPKAAGSLKVSATIEGSARSFRLAVEDDATSPALEGAESLRQQGRLQEAVDQLELLIKQSQGAAERARATGKLARIARRRGDLDQAVQLFDRAIELDREAGLISDAVYDTFVLSLVHETRLDFASARKTLETAEPWEQNFPQGRVMGFFYRGLLHAQVGELREALQMYERSLAGSRRLGLVDHEIDVLQQHAELLSRLGRGEEALQDIDQAERLFASRPWKACAAAQLLTNRGWTTLLARNPLENARPALDPVPPLLEARHLYDRACPDSNASVNVEINLATAALAAGDLGGAQFHVAAARNIPADLDSTKEWLSYLEGKIALEDGKPEDALKAFERLTPALDPNDLYTPYAAVDRARALEQLDRIEDARLAYASSDVLLDRRSSIAPLGAGRTTFLGQYLDGTMARIDFLVRQSERGSDPRPWLMEAAEAARRSNSRVLRTLTHFDSIERLSDENRIEWERALAGYRRDRGLLLERVRAARYLPAVERAAEEEANRSHAENIDHAFERALSNVSGETAATELRTPSRGELMLIFHPLRDGWIGFAASTSEIRARRLGKIDLRTRAAELGNVLLAPFRPQLAGATKVRIAAAGPLDQLDFASLMPRDLARLPVVYGLDVAHPVPREEQEGTHRALIVADPTGDLESARREGELVARLLLERGFRVELLKGTNATQNAVQRALEEPEVTLFHYAGHARFLGADGWKSSLQLADDGSLPVSDILALKRVPPVIVLSSCETARSEDHAPAGGLGIAQAFVISGARSVVASTGDIEGEVAGEIMRTFYEARAIGPAEIPVVLNHLVQFNGYGSNFRVLEP